MPGAASQLYWSAEGRVDVAVFGFHVDFDLRMVRPQVALAAGFGLAGFHDGKAVPGVATGATALAAVQVDAAHAHVGPGVRVRLAVLSFSPPCRGSDSIRRSVQRRCSCRLFSQGSIFQMISMVLACLLTLYCLASSGWHREQSLGVTTAEIGTLYSAVPYWNRTFVLLVMVLAHIRVDRLGLVAVHGR